MNTLLLLSALTITNLSEGQADQVCSKIEKNDTVVIDSDGGLVDEFLKLGDCLHEKKTNVIVKKAVSSAAYLASSAVKACVYPDSVIAYHSPFTKTRSGRMKELSVDMLRSEVVKAGNHLEKWGMSQETVIQVSYLTLLTPPNKTIALVGVDGLPVLNNGSLCNTDLIAKN